jgi:hypothetical protein
MIAFMMLGGAEIVLILVVLLFFAVMALGLAVLVYLVVRAASNRPAPAPATLPPEVNLENQQRRDRDHLKLLVVFHFVFAGLALVGMGFLCVHYAIMHTFFSNPGIWKSQQQDIPIKTFLDAFIWFYLFMGVLLLTGLVLNVLSAFFLAQKRHRLFSLVIGGLNCLQIPFGTALGIFTIVVLSRDSVRRLYSGQAEQ